jgi:TRAP-type uncharacterized transport system fused permease subunit
MDAETSHSRGARLIGYLVFTVALVMAVTGIVNSMPTYGVLPAFGPFLSVIIRPLILGASIFLVLAGSPFSRAVAARWPERKWLGWLLDITLLVAGWVVLWIYYSEQIAIEQEGFAEFTMFHVVTSIVAALVFIVLSWKVWGAPLSIVALIALFYFYTGEYWPWIFETAPLDLLYSAEDLWFNLNDGILGMIMGILIFTVFPFILSGTMLERTGGGRPMIKLAVHVTKGFRGGPAHAAIMASGLFWHHVGGRRDQRGGHRRDHHPDDQTARLFPGLRRRRRGDGIFGRPDHAADHGRRRPGHVGPDRYFLFEHYRRRADPGAGLLCQPVYVGRV